MGKVVIDKSMSLDGFIAAPGDTPEQGLGEDGMRLHNWAFDDPSVFERVFGNVLEETGAVIMGRRSYDNSIAEWGGKGPLGDVPCFVVTHRSFDVPDAVFTVVTDGIESALAQARDAAGDKHIGVMGASLGRQFLAAGLVDEIRIHLVDVLLGGGRRLHQPALRRRRRLGVSFLGGRPAGPRSSRSWGRPAGPRASRSCGPAGRPPYFETLDDPHPRATKTRESPEET